METLTDGDIWIYTYRTGLLKSVGHDLRLSLRDFEITHGDGEVSARFWTESIEVDGAIYEGELDRGELSSKDRAKIKGNIRDDVLETDAYPEVRFEGRYEPQDDEVYEIGGELEIVGVTNDLRMEVRRDGGRFVGGVELAPSDWGIEPYKALMGSLRLEDRVRIEFEVRAGDR